MTIDVYFPRFNPTLVRLRRSQPSRYLEQQQRFQSHAGSIEAIPTSYKHQVRVGFQSHAGSIEANLTAMTTDGEPPVFQSHAGSIEA